MRTLSDQPARDAILESLDQNMVVEAGAGTGKTRSLVDRVVALIKTGRARLGSVAAITFTESAAAELRARIAESLELAADDAGLPQERQERCRQAVAELDQASIQTLHSFAGRLLGERPLAAGLPPGFHHPRRDRVRDRIRKPLGSVAGRRPRRPRCAASAPPCPDSRNDPGTHSHDRGQFP